MGTERFKGALLPTLMIVSLVVLALLLSSTGSASAPLNGLTPHVPIYPKNNKLTDSCTKIVKISIFASSPNQPPRADFNFSPERPIVGEKVYFFDNSEDLDGYIMEWYWSYSLHSGDNYWTLPMPFGNGEQNPTLTFDHAGEAQITLEVTDDNGAIDRVSRAIQILPSVGLADTPWPKFRHDEKNTGRSPYVAAQNNALKWSCAIGCGIGNLGEAPSPAVGADGTIYMGSDDNRLYALNPDGTLKWFYETGRAIRSSPAIGTNGTIYITSEDGRLYALDENGTLRWTFDNVYAYPSPAIGPDGTVYIGSREPYFVSLSALHENGDLKWSFSTGLLRGVCGIDSCPAIGPDGTIYFTVVDVFTTRSVWDYGYGPVGFLFALDDNGALKWKRWDAGGTSSPAIGADNTIYVGSGNKLMALTPDNTIKWSHVIGRACSSPAIGSDGTIFVGGNVTLHALNPDNTLKWSYATGGIIWSSPAVGVGTVYVGSSDGKLYAFFENGTLMWTYATGGEVCSSPAIGAEGTIYVGSVDGKLYAIGGLAKFSLVTLYEIGLDVDLYLPIGSKLIVKFYTYEDACEGENLLWSGATPQQVILSENLPHPDNKPVKEATLVLADNEGNVVQTMESFIVRKDDLILRVSAIKSRWPIADDNERSVLIQEVAGIKGQWDLAPP